SQGSRHWWRSELDTFAAVEFAAPESSIRISYVSNPLSVAREIDIARRDTTKKRHEIGRLRVVAHQFPTRLDADDKKFFTILAENYVGKLQGTGRKLNRFVGAPSPESRFFAKDPNVAGKVLLA